MQLPKTKSYRGKIYKLLNHGLTKKSADYRCIEIRANGFSAIKMFFKDKGWAVYYRKAQ